jgi:hypothetical protein
VASNRRRSIKSLGKVVSNIDARLRYLQKRPAPRRIAKRVVTTRNIVKNAVTTVEIAPDAVTTVEIAPDAVTPAELAPNAVTNEAIAPGAVTDTELADGAGGAKTYRQDTQPATGYEGDLWFDTDDDNKLYTYTGSAWSSVRDLGIAAAQTAASAAQTTADGKNKVYRQTAEPTGGTYAEGDLWFDTDDNNKIYRRTGSVWTAVTLGGEALANINANKITAGSIDASVITVSNLDAGNITTGTIAASRITSTSISAANITAAQITSGEISSARITTSSISAASINADNITAGRIYAGDVEIGNDVGPGGGHYGVSLSSSDFNNIFIRRSDGVYFFRCGLGTANSIDFNSLGGLNIVGSITGASTVLIGNATSAGYLYINEGARMIVNGVRFQNRNYSGWDGAFYPYYDDTYDLGIGASSSGAGDAFMWQDIRYRGTLTDFSDRRMKLDIKESPLGLQFIDALKPVSYRKAVRKKEATLDESGSPIRNDDDSIVYEELEGVRTHYGLIAQDVRAALESIGVDPGTFAPWRLEHLDDPDSMQSLGYIGFIAPMIKAIQELSAKVKELESNK